MRTAEIGPDLRLPVRGALHLPRNSRNYGWDKNGKHVFQAFQRKIPGNVEKIVLYFPLFSQGGAVHFIKKRG